MAKCSAGIEARVRPNRPHIFLGWMASDRRDAKILGPSRGSICLIPIWRPTKRDRLHAFKNINKFEGKIYLFYRVRRSPSPLLSKLYQKSASYLLGFITVFNSVNTFKFTILIKHFPKLYRESAFLGLSEVEEGGGNPIPSAQIAECPGLFFLNEFGGLME